MSWLVRTALNVAAFLFLLPFGIALVAAVAYGLASVFGGH